MSPFSIVQLNMDLFRKTLLPVQKVLEDANFKVSDVDEVVLVGGSTRIPKVRVVTIISPAGYPFPDSREKLITLFHPSFGD